MSSGLFKDRISQASPLLSSGASIPSDAGAAARGPLDVPSRSWTDKIDGATTRKGGNVLPAEGLSGGDMPQTPVQVEVRIGGHLMAMKMAFVEQLQTRHAVNELPSATLVLSIPQASQEDDKALEPVMSLCQVGQSATLTMGPLRVFDGVIGAVKVSVDSRGRRVKVLLKNQLQRLKATPHSRIWKPQPDATLLREVLREHQVSVSSMVLPATEDVQRFQWNCSDWHFLRAVLGVHGAWLWPHADGSVKVQPPRLGGKTHRVSAKHGGRGSIPLDVAWEYSGLSQPRQLTTQSWDLSKQAVVQKTAKSPVLGHGGLAPTSVKALGAEGGGVLTGQWTDMSQQAEADGWLAALQAQAVRVRLTLPGGEAYQVGDTVALEGFGSHLDGQGIVTLVEHRCDVNERVGKTVIGVGLDEAAASAPLLSMPLGPVIGQVMPYQVDPKGKAWNRLPVKVPILGQEIIWARMGHVYASKDSGVTFYPEAGDEVVLAFFGDAPVIMASLHNPKRTAAIEPDAKNAKKGMVLRHNGQRVELSFDRDMSAAVWALGTDKTPEQQVVIDKAKGVTVTSLEGDMAIEVKAGGATVTTKKNMTLTTDEHLALVGKKGLTATSDNNVELGAQKSLIGKGNTEVQMASAEGKLTLTPEKADLSAGQTHVKGNMSVNIEGTGSVTVTGAEVDVKGNTRVAVTGNAVVVKADTEIEVQARHVKVAGEKTDVGGMGLTQISGGTINLG